MIGIFCFFTLLQLISAREQTVTVIGELICDKKHVTEADIELYERDFCKDFFEYIRYMLILVDPDDFLGTGKIVGGHFTLTGTENEFFSITPYIRIKHKCDVPKNCYRISEYEVPESKIDEVYELTYVSLNLRPQHDYVYCD